MSLLRHHQLLMSARSLSPPVPPKVWLDGADTSTIVEGAGGVVTWLDKSGNDYHFGNDFESNRPAKGTQGVVFYNGNTGPNTVGTELKYLHSASTTEILAVTMYAVVSDVVNKSESASTVVSKTVGFSSTTLRYRYIDALYMGATSQARVVHRDGGTPQVASTNIPFAGGAKVLLRGRFPASNYRSIRANNGSQSANTTNLTYNIGDIVFLGTERLCQTSYPTNGASLTILEVLLYDTDLNSSDDDLVTSYLMTKWGIS